MNDTIGGDPSLVTEIVAMLMLRSGQDTLTFTAADFEELRRVFPDGHALLAYGDDHNRTVSIKLLGYESRPLVDAIYDELEDGRTDLLERLFKGS